MSYAGQNSDVPSHVPAPSNRMDLDVSAHPIPDSGSFRSSSDLPESREYTDSDGNVFSYCIETNEALQKRICIIGCKPAGRILHIPSAIEGLPVTASAVSAFSGLRNVEEIYCPDNLTDIGGHAFSGCTSLQILFLPANCSRFDSFWINGDYDLKVLRMPGMLDSIESSAFRGQWPEKMILGRGCQKIDTSAFMSSGLRELEIDEQNECFCTDGTSIYSKDMRTFVTMAVHTPSCQVIDGCRNIGKKAFAYNKDVEKIVLPQTIESIEPYAFLGTKITEFSAPDNLRSIGEKAFYECRDLQAIELNDGLLGIGEEAFARSGISEVKIPSTVELVGHEMFDGTPLLANSGTDSAIPHPFTCLGAGQDGSLPKIFMDEMGGVYRQEDDGLTMFELLPFSNITSSAYEVLDGTKRVGDYAFYRHPSIEKVVLPEGLTEIGDSAFKSCKCLRRIVYPSTLKSIGEEAFVDSPVENLYIPAGLEEIGQTPFVVHGSMRVMDISRLKEVVVDSANPRYYLKNGLLCERLGDGTSQAIMYVGPNLDVTIPPEVVRICQYAFSGIRGLKSIRFHKDVRSAGFCSLMVDGSVATIWIELGSPIDALDGNGKRDWIEVRFPSYGSSRRFSTVGFPGGKVDPYSMFFYSDSLIYWTKDIYLRSRMALERLADPIFMNETNEQHLRSMFEHDISGVSKAFVSNGYLRGFDELAKLGFLNADNIGRVIESIDSNANTEATAYLLDLKHKRFGKTAGSGKENEHGTSNELEFGDSGLDFSI